ncbi:MAG: amidohydrolase family protein [Candidatus Latescibacterota bacterium]|nr:amidohydrolase family protein [Candidatus Latescibacterota bacterium]
MDRHGVDEALVYPIQGEAISTIDGNEQQRKWIEEGDGRLRPLWMASSHPDSLSQLRDLHASGELSAVRLHDTQSVKLPFTRWLYGDLLEFLQAHELPLWLSLADGDAREIVASLEHYPELISVLCGAHYTHAALVAPMLRALPRAHLELSRYEVANCGVEWLAREFGPRRLLYGSFFPRYAMGPMLFYLYQLDLNEAQRELICVGNARRLLQQPPGSSP